MVHYIAGKMDPSQVINFTGSVSQHSLLLMCRKAPTVKLISLKKNSFLFFTAVINFTVGA